jgi:hypothetical protein
MTDTPHFAGKRGIALARKCPGASWACPVPRKTPPGTWPSTSTNRATRPSCPATGIRTTGQAAGDRQGSGNCSQGRTTHAYATACSRSQ